VWLNSRSRPPTASRTAICDLAAPTGWSSSITGRHPCSGKRSWRWRGEDAAIVAIVNTHWHLDHVSGNPGLRRRVSGPACLCDRRDRRRARRFLAQSAKDAAAYLDDPQIPQAMRDDIRRTCSRSRTVANLKPDVVLDASGDRSLAAVRSRFTAWRMRVTAGDLWLYDAANRLAVLGIS